MYFTPVVPKDTKGHINPQVLNLAQTLCINSAKLSSLYHKNITKDLEDIFKIVNTHYSNALEHQVVSIEDIYTAQNGTFSEDKHTKDLQFLSLYYLHMEKYLIQKANYYDNPYSSNLILDLHERFYSQIGMEKFLTVRYKNQSFTMKPGCVREFNLKIRNQETPNFGLINLLLSEFENHYGAYNKQDKVSRLIHALCSYHRLIWIHPFIFDNERIARMHLNFVLSYMGLEGSGLWSISRGIYKHLDKYKKALLEADKKKGFSSEPLSREGLENYLIFMLKVCLEEVEFSKKCLLAFPEKLKEYVQKSQNGEFENINLPQESEVLFEKFLLFGEFSRGSVKDFINKKDRASTYFLKSLSELDLIYSDTPRGDVKLKFNPHLFTFLFDGLV